jgi:hypothetical protein
MIQQISLIPNCFHFKQFIEIGPTICSYHKHSSQLINRHVATVRWIQTLYEEKKGRISSRDSSITGGIVLANMSRKIRALIKESC